MLDNLYSLYEDLKRDGVIFCFSGPATQSMVEVVGQTLKRKMELEDAGMSTVQRVFSLFVEQMQNVMNYSAEKIPEGADGPGSLRHGVVVVGQESDCFYVLCGNKVTLSQCEKMEERIAYLNSLSKTELKDYYKAMRRENPEEDSKGAGLGFIEMFRRASEPPQYMVTPIDSETVFFSIKAKGC